MKNFSSVEVKRIFVLVLVILMSIFVRDVAAKNVKLCTFECYALCGGVIDPVEGLSCRQDCLSNNCGIKCPPRGC